MRIAYRVAQLVVIIALLTFLAGCSSGNQRIEAMALGELTPSATSLGACFRDGARWGWSKERTLDYCLAYGLGDI